MICSVKFFEPTTAVFWRERWQPASVTNVPPSNVRASRLVRRASIVWMTDGSRCRREVFLAQAARADGGRNRGNAYADDHGNAHSGENHGNGEGQLHIPKNLSLSHAHAARGLENCRIDARNSGVGVAQNWEQRIKGEGDDSGPCADASQKGHRNQKSE